MRKVDLRMNELEKFKIIKNLVEKNGNKKRAATKLNCTVRTINRLIQKYNKDEKCGFVHGNRNRLPSKTREESLKSEIIALYNGKYQESNFNHFRELLLEHENIDVSYCFIYNTLMKDNITSPKIQRKTKKSLAISKIKKENENLSAKEVK